MQVFPGLVVDQRGILLEDLVIAVAAGRLQRVNGFRIEQVKLAVLAPLVMAAGVEHMAVDLAVGKGQLMPGLHFPGDDVQADAADARRGAGEVLFNHRRMQADGFENLRAAIALDGRDAHLGSDLDHALDGGLDEILAGVLVLDVGEQTLADHVVERFEGEVGIDRARRRSR